MKIYIHQNKQWPHFTWDKERLINLLAKVRNQQGQLIGKMKSFGFDLQSEAFLETFTLDVLKTTEIEGIILDSNQIRSSIAKRLGIDIAGLPKADRDVEGVVDMMFDATKNYNKKLTKERLFDWHFSLFPTGRVGMNKIIVGDWRDDSTGPMQVVSGALGKEKVHFEAPSSNLIDKEITSFLIWINKNQDLDIVLKAGIAHLWFLTIHPFEDGNGRISRAITDMFLAKSDGVSERFYSMSAQIRKERKAYYQILEKTQKGDLDLTDWLFWFLNCLSNALTESDIILAKVIYKHNFWRENAMRMQNNRQKLLLNKLLDGFTGKLTSSKWGKIAKCSQDTALRDIQDLIDKGILKKSVGGGRNTNYELNNS